MPNDLAGVTPSKTRLLRSCLRLYATRMILVACGEGRQRRSLVIFWGVVLAVLIVAIRITRRTMGLPVGYVLRGDAATTELGFLRTVTFKMM